MTLVADTRPCFLPFLPPDASRDLECQVRAMSGPGAAGLEPEIRLCRGTPLCFALLCCPVLSQPFFPCPSRGEGTPPPQALLPLAHPWTDLTNQLALFHSLSFSLLWASVYLKAKGQPVTPT